ncbi:hypothetical protein SVIO_076690 [Streptomyces violaceusniger]|uniref:Uncharacterized protein n=1 Tax=Streptomyces violaceusniger TaxID=68280 RepID=A0A4D4LCW5_STRVO|nr:hypothetical protein SVIO_076690 [Streptomyces violaceusniger]
MSSGTPPATAAAATAVEARKVLRLGGEVEAEAWEFGIASTLRGVPAVRPMVELAESGRRLVEALRYCAEVKAEGGVAQEWWHKVPMGSASVEP